MLTGVSTRVRRHRYTTRQPRRLTTQENVMPDHPAASRAEADQLRAERDRYQAAYRSARRRAAAYGLADSTRATVRVALEQHHRADKAETGRDEASARLEALARVRVWRNGDGKGFLFADDVARALDIPTPEGQQPAVEWAIRVPAVDDDPEMILDPSPDQKHATTYLAEIRRIWPDATLMRRAVHHGSWRPAPTTETEIEEGTGA